MFDGRFRAEAERTLKPVGAQLKRTGITADQLTLTGIVMAAAAAVAIATGHLALGLLLLVLTALPDVLDGAVAKASGTAPPRGAFFDSVADRFTDASCCSASPGTSRPPSPGGSPSCRWRSSAPPC